MSRPRIWTYEKIKEITDKHQGKSLNSLKGEYKGLVERIRRNYSAEQFGLTSRKSKPIDPNRIHRGKYTNSSEWSSYKNMRLRCYDPNHRAYKWYGGKGIKVCDRWMETPYGFLNMIDDLGGKPDRSYQIDRIDENKDYCPENCMWSTHKEQQWRRSKKRDYPNRICPSKHNINPGDKFGEYTVIKELESIRRRKFLCKEVHTGKIFQIRIDRLLKKSEV